MRATSQREISNEGRSLSPQLSIRFIVLGNHLDDDGLALSIPQVRDPILVAVKAKVPRSSQLFVLDGLCIFGQPLDFVKNISGDIGQSHLRQNLSQSGRLSLRTRETCYRNHRFMEDRLENSGAEGCDVGKRIQMRLPYRRYAEPFRLTSPELSQLGGSMSPCTSYPKHFPQRIVFCHRSASLYLLMHLFQFGQQSGRGLVI